MPIAPQLTSSGGGLLPASSESAGDLPVGGNLLSGVPSQKAANWSLDAAGNPRGLVGPAGTVIEVGPTPFGQRPSSGLVRTRHKGLTDFHPWHSPVLDLATAGAYGDSFISTGTLTPAVDATVTWKGKPTQRCVIAGTTSTSFQTGTSGETVALGLVAQTLGAVGVGWVVALKCPVPAGFPNTAVRFLIGDAAFANYRRYNATQTVETADGWRIWTINSTESGAIDEVTGSPTLTGNKRVRLLFNKNSALDNGIYYIGGVSVVPARRPTVVLTFDDGYDEWLTYLVPALRERGLPASFGIDGATVGTTGALTLAQLVELASDPLFELTNHGWNNTAYSPGVNLSTYLTNLDRCDAVLRSVSAPEAGRRLHAYVQGTHDGTLITEMIARGYTSMREVGAEDRPCRPLLAYYNGQPTITSAHNRYTIPAGVNLTAATTVAAARGYVENAITSGSMLMVMGHKFEAAAGILTWVAGYDVNNGMSNFLDWLSEQRNAGRLDVVRWSDWVTGLDAGVAI